jgi:hypothetical protein
MLEYIHFESNLKYINVSVSYAVLWNRSKAYINPLHRSRNGVINREKKR